MNLSSIFKMIILSSVIGSVIAIIIFVIKGVFKNRLNAFWQYYIWFLLIIRLIIPTGFETPLSKFNNIEFAAEKIQSHSNSSKTTNDLESVSEINLQNVSEVSGLKLNEEGSLKETVSKDFNYYFNIASIIWVSGAVFAFLIILFINCIFIFKVYKQPFCEDKDTLKVLEKCKSIMNISRDIPIICDRYVKVPSLFGNIKPKILISSDFIHRLSVEQKKYIFLHELSHFKRKDIFISWIMLFCGILNWFNPIIWFFLHKMWEDCELACDAYVLSHLKEKEQGEYGKTIIDMAKFVSDIKYIPGATGIIKGNSNIKRRIIMMKKFKKSPYKWSIAVICILIAVCITGITNAPIKAAVLKNEGELLQKEQSNIDYVNIVEGFLPANSQIVTSGNTKEEENILLKDLDNDGQREIITAYKSSGQPISEDEKINLLVLKKVGEKWFKALDESGQGFKLDLVLTADIDGDGREEVLLSRRIEGTAGEIFVYQWNNNVLSKVSDEGVYYSKLDIVDVPGKDIKDIAVWQHDTGDAYMIDILKWNGKIFVPEKIDCPDYFKQSVVPYYEQKVKEMPGAGFYWYYLAEAQLKSADKKGALKSAEKGLKLDTGYPPKEYFNEIKEKASK
ncbi:M56 family metallopeptidase [Clostridium kluyveri]|uniref:Predicted regulatory protein n=2 Tax=Clostridium kluyveri TaxID=1534 RepID=A5MZF1_CLOK5|nr:M56 family metallopeptidase [Clostridium kluyveri]EDK34247.1 Predicted regulatory protein [Clostridium kluyveri DSM 555]